MTLGVIAVGGVLILLALVLPPRAAMVIGLMLIMASSTSLSILESASIAVRILAMVVIITLAARTPLPESARSRAGRDTVMWLVAFVLAIGSMLSFIAIAHNEFGIFTAILGVVCALVFAFMPLRVLTARQVARAVRDALLVVLLASLMLAVVAPGIAYRGGRFQGLTGNANLLGFYVLLYLALVLGTSTNVRALLIPVALSGVVLILAGSRTSAIAVVALFGASALLRVGATRRLLPFLVVGALGTMLLAQDLLTSDTGLLRVNTSRSDSWDQTKLALHLDPWSGVGLDSLQVEVASSPLRALAAGGLIGGAIFLLSLIFLLAAARRNGALQALTFAAVLHSFGEGWLVSLTGPMILLFVTCLSSLAALPSPREHKVDMKPAAIRSRPGHHARGGRYANSPHRTLPAADAI